MYLYGALAGLFIKLTFAVPAGFEHTLEARQTPSNSCVTGVHVIASPGEGFGGTDYSLIGTLVTNITSRIPNSNSFLIGPYPNGNGLVQTEGGEAQLRQYLADYQQTCPNASLVLVGYSAGAITSLNAVCGASPAPPWTPSQSVVGMYTILAMVLYGDETFAHGMPYNRGTCNNSAPNYLVQTAADAQPYILICDHSVTLVMESAVQGEPIQMPTLNMIRYTMSGRQILSSDSIISLLMGNGTTITLNVEPTRAPKA